MVEWVKCLDESRMVWNLAVYCPWIGWGLVSQVVLATMGLPSDAVYETCGKKLLPPK
jgi:hypothetical protein